MNNVSPSLPPIQKLKQKLDQAKEAYYAQQELLHKREETEKAFHKVKNREENDILKKAIKEFDRILDSSEEISEDLIEAIKQELLTHIFQAHPTAVSEHENQLDQLKQMASQRDELIVLSHSLSELKKLLDQTVSIRQKFKGGGILLYLLGNQPNLRIEKLFSTGRLLIEKLLLLLRKSLDTPLPPPFYRNLEKFLSELLGDLKRSWSFRFIDTVVVEAAKNTETYLMRCEETYKQIKHKTEQLERSLDLWLDHFISNPCSLENRA